MRTKNKNSFSKAKKKGKSTKVSGKFISQEPVVQRCSVKKVFLEISQNSQENPCARVSFLITLQASGLQLYLKRGSGTGAFL